MLETTVVIIDMTWRELVNIEHVDLSIGPVSQVCGLGSAIVTFGRR